MKNNYKILLLVLFLNPIILFCNNLIIESDSLIFICNELLGRPTSNSITIHAEANKSLEVYYEYGTDSSHYSSQTETKTCPDSIPYVFVIDNLQPNTQYFYRMRYRETGTTDYIPRSHHSFHTQRASGSTFTFAIEADPHLDSNSIFESFALTLQNILSANPDFLLDLGDTFFSEKLANKSQSEITKRHLLLRSYFDIACHSVPLFLILGNHEGESGTSLNGTANNLAVMASNTRKLYYPNPEQNEFYSGNSKSEDFVGLRQNYYAFEWGNALIVVLDPYWYTKTRSDWGWTLGSEQYNWFKNTLTTSKSKFKFVFCHNLVGGTEKDARGGVEVADFYEWGGKDTNMTYSFDKNRPGWGKPIHQLMVENGVNIFFHGHDHFYDKQEKDGVIYQEVPQPSSKNIVNTQAAQYGYLSGVIFPSRGYLLVTVTDTSAKVDYIRTYLPNEEKGQTHNRDITYSYTILKTSPTSVNDNITYPKESILHQNYPNPFNRETSIIYNISKASNVQLKIFDVFDKEIITLVNHYQEAGNYSVTFDANQFGIPDGLYFYKLLSGNKIKTNSMIFIK
jgi:DNA repair exonuclease SbcCD nuclease subunit